MSAIETNITLRANRFPALSPAQEDFLRARPDLGQRFANALAIVERVRVEGDEDDRLFAIYEPVLSRNYLCAIIGELSILVPTADAELAEAQARVRRSLFPESFGVGPGRPVCVHCSAVQPLSA